MSETVERVARIIAYRDLSSIFGGSLLARAIEVRWREYKDDARSVITEIAAVLRRGDLGDPTVPETAQYWADWLERK